MALSSADQRFLDRLGTRLGKAALRRARPRVRQSSSTLARAMVVLRPTLLTTWVYIPHYWSLYVHDGRRPFVKPHIMCWFRDPRLDPRLNAGRTPERVFQLRHLSREEFLYWMQQNRLADPTGTNPRARPMIVTKAIRKPTAPNAFFSNEDGMRGFDRDASRIVQDEFSRYVASVVPGVGEPIEGRAIVRL